MRPGITKVHQQTIPKILRNMAVKVLNDRSRSLLIGAYHLAPIFWVELVSEECRVDEVTEHHRELAAFGFGCATFNRRKYCLCDLIVSSRRLGDSLSCPDEDSAVLVTR